MDRTSVPFPLFFFFFLLLLLFFSSPRTDIRSGWNGHAEFLATSGEDESWSSRRRITGRLCWRPLPLRWTSRAASRGLLVTPVFRRVFLAPEQRRLEARKTFLRSARPVGINKIVPAGASWNGGNEESRKIAEDLISRTRDCPIFVTYNISYFYAFPRPSIHLELKRETKMSKNQLQYQESYC